MEIAIESCAAMLFPILKKAIPTYMFLEFRLKEQAEPHNQISSTFQPTAETLGRAYEKTPRNLIDCITT